MTNLAWHFIRRENGKDILRDGTEAPPDGVWLEFNGPLVMCKSGLHFSRDPFDALTYAPGEILCRVEVGGEIVERTEEHKDKGICSRRMIVKRIDATNILRLFARQQALSVSHLWDMPAVVREYLETGDESKRAASGAAAEAAARASRDSAWVAAWAAAGDSARAAAEAAARAAWAAARAAAWAASRKAWNAIVEEAFGK